MSVSPHLQSSEARQSRTEMLIAEYDALRSEIISRSTTQYQIVGWSFAIAGALVTIDTQSAGTISLIYPVIGFFFALLWFQHDLRIRQLGAYIRDRIEGELLLEGEGWEHRSPSARIESAPLTTIASNGIIVVTQLLTLIAGLLLSSFSPRDIGLLVFDVVVVGITVVIVRPRKYNFSFKRQRQ